MLPWVKVFMCTCVYYFWPGLPPGWGCELTARQEPGLPASRTDPDMRTQVCDNYRYVYYTEIYINLSYGGFSKEFKWRARVPAFKECLSESRNCWTRQKPSADFDLAAFQAIANPNTDLQCTPNRGCCSGIGLSRSNLQENCKKKFDLNVQTKTGPGSDTLKKP